MAGFSIIVMGVSGSGKSTIGEMLAASLQAKFIDGDDLHPRKNVEKMAQGQPLEDHDRQPWLERIGDAVFSLENRNQLGVIVCSALKKVYRDEIRRGGDNVAFVFLDGAKSIIADRMQAREGHFMKASMLDSQFDALERPGIDETDVITVTIDNAPQQIVDKVVSALNKMKGFSKKV